jgi:hypothetical protein
MMKVSPQELEIVAGKVAKGHLSWLEDPRQEPCKHYEVQQKQKQMWPLLKNKEIQ